MAQILVFGASTAYGVGGPQGGWPDLLKSKLHSEMYQAGNALPEAHEVYNLCVPGATIDDISKRILIELKSFSKVGRKSIAVIELGGNDAKAVESADSFVNTPENFEQQLGSLVELAKQNVDEVILVGLQPVDEMKTLPRTNPTTGKKSYFSNSRMERFEKSIESIANAKNVAFVSVFSGASKLNWIEEYLFVDGLHPNKNGHRWLYEQIYAVLGDFL